MDAHRHPDTPGRWVIHADPAEVERLRALHLAPRGQHTRRPWLANQQATLDTDIDTEPGGSTHDGSEPQL